MVALDTAFHRVLARDVAARRTQPPQAMSAMDGYAVRAADAADLTARLKVIGEVAAGRPFERKVGADEAVRIFTGGVIPDGADAVIIQEDTAIDGDHITITEAAKKGRHIRPAGVDFREGDVLLAKGRRLTDRDLSLAAGMNYPELAVRRRPKVAVLATGDELVMPGSDPRPRPDRLFQRLCDAGAGAGRRRRDHRSRHRRRHGRRHHRRHPPRPRRRRRYPDHHGRRLGRRPRPRQAVAGGRGRHHGVLADRDAAGQADDARTARRDAGDRPARQSGVLLCLRLPVSGAVDSRAVGPKPASIMRARRPCSAAISPPTTSAKTIFARASNAARTAR